MAQKLIEATNRAFEREMSNIVGQETASIFLSSERNRYIILL